jgi:hypothetical protein
MADVGQKERIMKILNVTAQEADEILAYDKLVEQGKPTPYDLSPEEEKKLRKYRQADRKPTAYKFSQRERKPNATKEGLVVEIATFLAENSGFDTKNVEITNKNREITFTVGEDTFTWTLVQKRKPKN